jgi:hypothetical protein
MKLARNLLATTAVAAGAMLALAGPASALTIFTIGVSNSTQANTGGDVALGAGWSIVDDYNAHHLPTNGVGRDGVHHYSHGVTEFDSGPVALYDKTIIGLAAEPYNSLTRRGNFEAIQPDGHAIFELGHGIRDFSAYLGSIDQYNDIEILGKHNKVLESLTGADLGLGSEYGDQSAGIDNRRLFIDNLPADATGIEFFTTGVAFEFDNIAVSDCWNPRLPNGDRIGPGVPEPGVWSMMLVGLFSLGAMLRISRRKQLGAVAAV